MNVYLVCFAAVGLLDLWMALFSYRRHNKFGISMMHLSLAAAMTSFTYFGYAIVDNYRLSSFFSSLYFVGVLLTVYLIMRFVSAYTEYNYADHKAGRFAMSLLHFWILLDIIVTMINPFYETNMHYRAEVIGGHTLHRYEALPLYSAHLMLCYTMIGMVFFALFWRLRKTPKVYRRTYYFQIGIIVLIVVLNAAYLLGARYFELDISLLFYSIGVALFYYSVFEYTRQELLRTTRIFALETLSFPIVVFDYHDRLVDFNKCAGDLFPELQSASRTMQELSIDTFLADNRLPAFDPSGKPPEWRKRTQDGIHTFQSESHLFYDHSGTALGKMLILRDVTYQKDSATGLDLSTSLYHFLATQISAPDYPTQILCINVNSLNMINHALGHHSGNLVMRSTVDRIRSVIGGQPYMARMEDGTITVVLPGTDADTVRNNALQIAQDCAEDNTLGFSYSIEYGVSELNSEHTDAYTALEDARTSMRNRKLLSTNSHDSMLIHSLTQTLTESDFETEAHVERTREASERIADFLGLNERERSELALLSMLHDIGKVGIPSDILLKPGKLTDEEWEIMKSHTEKGYRIAMASNELEPIARLILHHHERWDGNGYPARLKGEQIPLLSRIITVVDSFDVMTHDRPYHKAISVAEARAELVRCSGSQFDPEIVGAYLRLLDSEAQKSV